MSTTIVLVIYVLGLLFVPLALWAIFLRFGLRWVKVEGITKWRMILATISWIVLLVVSNILSSLLPSSLNVVIIEFVVSMFVYCYIVAVIFKARMRQACLAVIPAFVSIIIGLIIIVLITRPFLFEGFVSPPNGMAPTLLGNHWRGVCPQCNQPNFGSPMGSGRY